MGSGLATIHRGLELGITFRLEENAVAVDVLLSEDELPELDSAISPDAVRGGRYPEAMMALLNA